MKHNLYILGKQSHNYFVIHFIILSFKKSREVIVYKYNLYLLVKVIYKLVCQQHISDDLYYD